MKKEAAFVRKNTPWLSPISHDGKIWLQFIQNQSQQFDVLDSEIVGILQYFGALRSNVTRINKKVAKAVLRLERLEPSERVPTLKAHRKILQESLRTASDFLNQELIDSKIAQIEVRDEILEAKRHKEEVAASTHDELFRKMGRTS
jgi:hypothetical protein